MNYVALGDIAIDARSGFASGDSDADGIVQIRMNNVTTNGALIWDKVRRVPRPKNLGDLIAEPGDILFNATNSPELVGKSALFPGYDEPVTFSNHFLRLRFDAKRVVPGYVVRWLHAQWMRRIFDNMCKRWVNQASVGKSDLLSLSLPLPPLRDQERIAEILDQADSLRRLRQRAIDRLSLLLRSTFLTLFGDPVTNPFGFPLQSLPKFYISPQEGTKCGPFGSALKKDELVVSGIPVWNMDNIDISGRMVLPFRMWITKEKYEELMTYSVVDGDVLISRAGTVGKMCVVNSGCAASILSTNLIRIRFGPDLLPIYFVSLMTYCKGHVGRLRTGPDGAFTHMNTGVLDKIKFPYPPLDLQRRFAAIVESAEQQRAYLCTHLAELDALFLSLQHRAFRGEL
jgi:type I restriction enzyme, S subunit